MSFLEITVFTLKFYIPSLLMLLFRVFVLGYKSKKRVALGVTVHALYMLFVPAALIVLIGYGEYTHIVFYVMTIGSLSVLIFTTDPPAKTIFLQFVQAVMVATMSAVLSMVRHLTGSSYAMLLLATAICSVLLFAIGMRFFVEPMRFIRDHLHGNIPMLLMPFLVMLISVFIPTYPPQNFANHPVFCTGITLMVQVGFFLYMYTLYKNLHTIKRLTTQEKQREILGVILDAAKQRIFIMDEAVGRMRVYQHDQRHLNVMLLELLQSEHIEAAAALISQQTEKFTQKPISYCENIMVNAVVDYYATIAVQRGIRCDIRLDIPKDPIFEELTLSMVISNLMENAIHACKNLGQERESYLTVSVICARQLILEAENPYAGEVRFDKNGYPIARGKEHGHGSASVRTFVEETGGEILYKVENGIFNVRLLV